MTPYQKALEYAESIKARLKLAATPPAESITLPSIEKFIQYILCPHEPVSEFGILYPRIVTEELAEILTKHPHFYKHGMIEDCGDKVLRLWRKKDWDGTYPQWLKQQKLEQEQQRASIIQRERVERTLDNMIAQRKGWANHRELAMKGILTLISKSEAGDEEAKKLLTTYGYFDDNEI